MVFGHQQYRLYYYLDPLGFEGSKPTDPDESPIKGAVFIHHGSTVRTSHKPCQSSGFLIVTKIWVVVKIVVLFWVLIIVRHLILRVPKKGP